MTSAYKSTASRPNGSASRNPKPPVAKPNQTLRPQMKPPKPTRLEDCGGWLPRRLRRVSRYSCRYRRKKRRMLEAPIPPDPSGGYRAPRLTPAGPVLWRGASRNGGRPRGAEDHLSPLLRCVTDGPHLYNVVLPCQPPQEAPHQARPGECGAALDDGVAPDCRRSRLHIRTFGQRGCQPSRSA